MLNKGTRRDFLSNAGMVGGTGWLASAMSRAGKAATTKGPNDFVIVEGHRDIWELIGRTRLREEAQRLPLTNFIVPSLIDGGVSVVIMPAGRESHGQRRELVGMISGR